MIADSAHTPHLLFLQLFSQASTPQALSTRAAPSPTKRHAHCKSKAQWIAIPTLPPLPMRSNHPPILRRALSVSAFLNCAASGLLHKFSCPSASDIDGVVPPHSRPAGKLAASAWWGRLAPSFPPSASTCRRRSPKCMQVLVSGSRASDPRHTPARLSYPLCLDLRHVGRDVPRR